MAEVPAPPTPPTREAAVPATKMAPAAGAATTTSAPLPPATAAGRATNPPVYTPSGSTAVGKATVERMITQNKNQTRNMMLVIGLVLLAIVGESRVTC